MVEELKADGGGALDDDIDDGMRCAYHPYRSSHGGICALCLQEKLGRLVSSSSPVPLRASSSSSSSSSFRSDFAAAAASAASSAKFGAADGAGCHDRHAARNRIPFLLNKKKKKPEVGFRRSKSTATPGRGKFLDPYDGGDFIPKNRGWIWSLFDLSKSSRKIDHSLRESSKIASLPTAAIAVKQKEKYAETARDSAGAAEDDGADDSPTSSQATASVSSFERKVSRSRSVGCGSRSFSGDFFERISTGFGDCTLRRVESHREGKPKLTTAVSAAVHGGDDECLKERVKCGGIFGGFMIQTSSSSSSGSSSYWVSSSSGEEGRFPAAAYVQGRSKNRGWTFASPMRAFVKPPFSSSEGKRETSEKNSSTPSLDAIPSLLAVRI
ncbi:uncharacterized protein DDB_G0271670-like [Momordica charantia]|uniref:Uncharacterized protein DDB_G0271670-like n=1 Tax=Momordica charantia TaxID=3673 RepID=A0A6J1CBE0_MOMCH|nr:uncharacterized protein DDB_G0271670-like [Momordica charantia]